MKSIIGTWIVAFGLVACAADAGTDGAGGEELRATREEESLRVAKEAEELQRLLERLESGIPPQRLSDAEIALASLHLNSLMTSLGATSRAVIDDVINELLAQRIPPAKFAENVHRAPSAALPEFERAVHEYAVNFLFLDSLSQRIAARSDGLSEDEVGAAREAEVATVIAGVALVVTAGGIVYAWTQSDNVTVQNWQCIDRCGFLWASCCVWQCQLEVVDGPAAGTCSSMRVGDTVTRGN